MSEQGIVAEVEKQAAALQSQLNEFAAADIKTREKMLPDLFTLIKTNGTQEHLKTLPGGSKLNEQLNSAAQKTIDTPWKTSSRDKIKPWTGEHTLVTLQSDGTIVGFISTGVPESYLEWESTDEWAKKNDYHFKDLSPTALAKAAAALHLYNAVTEGHIEKSGGLSLPNIEYLKTLGFEYHAGAKADPVNLGAEEYYQGSSKPEITKIFLGASGCPLTPEYGATLLDVGGKTGTFTNAGAGDDDFAGETGAYMEEPSLEIQPIPEPEFARQAKIVRN